MPIALGNDSAVLHDDDGIGAAEIVGLRIAESMIQQATENCPIDARVNFGLRPHLRRPREPGRMRRQWQERRLVNRQRSETTHGLRIGRLRWVMQRVDSRSRQDDSLTASLFDRRAERVPA